MPSEEPKVPTFVQPDPQNEAEMQLARALQILLRGNSYCTSEAERQAETLAAVREGGLLAQTRREFRESVLTVVVPILEQRPPIELTHGDPELKKLLVDLHARQKTDLIAALRAAGAALDQETV